MIYVAGISTSLFIALVAWSFSFSLLQVALFSAVAAPVGIFGFKAINAIVNLFNHVDQSIRQVETTVRNANRAVTDLNRNLVNTTRQLDILIGNVNATVPEVREMVRDTQRTIRTINHAVERLEPHIVRTVDDTHNLLGQMNGAAEAIGTYGAVVTGPAAFLRGLRGRNTSNANRTVQPQPSQGTTVQRRGKGAVRPNR